MTYSYFPEATKSVLVVSSPHQPAAWAFAPHLVYKSALGTAILMPFLQATEATMEA